MSSDKSKEEGIKNTRSFTAFWSGAIVSYLTIVAGIWGFVEAYTYFEGETLKNAIGPYWIGIYLIPLPIALITGIIRSRVQSVPRAARNLDQKVHSASRFPSGQYLKYKGLLWKPARFSIQLPTPLCSRSNCGRPVQHKREYPPRYLVSSNLTEMQNFLNKQGSFKNVYRCPVHGELTEVPDIEIESLRREAQFELKK